MSGLMRIGGSVLYQPADPAYDQPCLYAVVGGSRTLMIDGGVTVALAKAFVHALRAETGRGVDYVAVTHWHWDHVFGLHAVDAPVIACKNTAAHLARLAGYASWSDEALKARVASGEEIPFCAEYIQKAYPGRSRDSIAIRLPDIVFDGSMSLDMGGLTCELLPLPPVHTDDCVAIHVPEERLLFVGDSTGPDFYGRPAHYSAPAVFGLFRWITGQGAAHIMESHAGPQSPEEFQRENGILVDAAHGVLAGCRNREGLLNYLRAACHGELPEDAGEVVELFLNGIGR